MTSLADNTLTFTPGGGEPPVVLTLFANGTFVLVTDESNPIDDGMERGTYNAAGSRATFTRIVDTNGDVDVTDSLGKAKLSTAFGIDVGAMYRPSSWLRVGIVAKDINAPSFDTKAGGEFKLDPQVRSGVAINPWD